MPVHIKAEGGTVLARPAGGVLATDCASGQTHCSPCIVHDQLDAALSVAGGCMSNDFSQSGLIQMHPETLFWCEAWDESTWAGDCVWVWANYVDISEWTAPGIVFDWVLLVSYDAASDTYDAAIYVGSDFDDGDPCNWAVHDTPAFTAEGIASSQAADPHRYIECGPDGKLHGTFDMEGQDTGIGGADASGCTATVTL